jgi:hypothetical protein
MVLTLAVPLTHASSPMPGIPMLFFDSLGGPYHTGQTSELRFSVENRGSETITDLSLEVKATQGWSTTSPSVRLGNLDSGSQKAFSIRVVVGHPTVAPITFTATSTNHIALDFSVSVPVASKVTPETIRRPEEAISTLIEISTQWGIYTVYKVGNVFFPNTAQGIISSEGLQEILKGYFVKDFLDKHSDLASLVSSLADDFSIASTSAARLRNIANQAYSFSVSFATYTVTYTTTVYNFLTWTIPLSEWTLGLFQDRRVADLLALVIREFFELNVSADDVVQFAEFLVRPASIVDPLKNYISDFRDMGKGLVDLASARVPDLSSLMKVLSSANWASSALPRASSIINDLNALVQCILTWVRQFLQQLYQIFESLIDWISEYLNWIPIIADAIKGAIRWLYNALSSAASYVISAIDSVLDAQVSTQPAQSGLADMTSAVGETSNSAWNSLNNRLADVAGQAKRGYDSFCTTYLPVLPQVKTATKWAHDAIAVVSMVAPHIGAPTALPFIRGLLLIENGIAAGCSASLAGKVDFIELISLTAGAIFLLEQVFPAEEEKFNAIGGILNGIVAAVTAYNQFRESSASVFDLGDVSAIVQEYDFASNTGLAAYQLPAPDYAGAIGAIASISNLPSIDAINTLLKYLEPYSRVDLEFATYKQEGMVAHDLKIQLEKLWHDCQVLISRIAAGDYSALLEAAAIPALARQLSDALDARYQQFIGARDALDRQEEAVDSLKDCGFLWAQPDPEQLRQIEEALQTARSQYSDGRYSDVIDSAGPNITRISEVNQLCKASAYLAKLQLGALTLVIVAVLGLFALMRTRRTRARTEYQEPEVTQQPAIQPEQIGPAAVELLQKAEPEVRMIPVARERVESEVGLRQPAEPSVVEHEKRKKLAAKRVKATRIIRKKRTTKKRKTHKTLVVGMLEERS